MDDNFIDYMNDLFGLFGNGTTKQMIKYEEELDSLYWTDKDHYLYRLSKIKENYKVLRNSKGQHKLEIKRY